MVMMMSVVTSASRAGPIASLATAKPISAVDRDGGRDRERGAARPRDASDAAIMPPSMMNSPWAKLMTCEAL